LAPAVLGRQDPAAAAILCQWVAWNLRIGWQTRAEWDCIHLLVAVGIPPLSCLQVVAASLLVALPHVDLAPWWALQVVEGNP